MDKSITTDAEHPHQTGGGTFWVEFEDRPSGTVELLKGEAIDKVAAQFGTVKKTHTLPYPSTPRLRTIRWTYPSGEKIVTPDFCYRPEQCKDHTSCTNPNNRSCTE